MSDKPLNLPREQFEPVVSQPMELDALGTELTLCFEDIGGPCEIRTCYGDICKIVNALRDYSKLLRMVCTEWNLQGFHQAVYEIHAETLEKISKKYQAGIGYDYDKAMEKCQKKRERAQRDDDVGGEALMMAYLKSRQAAQAKEKKAAGKNPGNEPPIPADIDDGDIPPWEENG